MEWRYGLLIVLLLVALAGGGVALEFLCIRNTRRRFLAGREMLSDADFCAQVCRDIPTDQFLWLAIRQAMADSIHVPPESLHSEDTLDTLGEMHSFLVGFDFLAVVFCLEKRLQIRISQHEIFPVHSMSREDIERHQMQTATLLGFGRFMVKGLRPMMERKVAEVAPPTIG